MGRGCRRNLEVIVLLFSNSDIELLRLAGWCKNLPSDIAASFHSQVFDSAGIALLDKLGLLNVTQNKKSIRLRERGWSFLRYLGMDFHKDTVYKSDYARRLEMSWLLLTFWRAGFNVFGATLKDLGTPQVFLHSMVARRNTAPGGNAWGGAVFWGLARLRNTVVSCYYVEGHEKMAVCFRNEKDMLNKAAVTLETQGAMLYAGSNYEKLARAVRNTASAEAKGKKTFAQIYRDTITPIYLLECSDNGALQLLIMAQGDYKKRLSDSMFNAMGLYDSLTAAPIGVTDADGALSVPGKGSMPWLLAVDMDLYRIDRALRQSVTAGYGSLLVICLETQADALTLLYGDKNTKIVTVTEENLLNAFGALRLYEPVPGAYRDPKGGMIDAAHLPAD